MSSKMSDVTKLLRGEHKVVLDCLTEFEEAVESFDTQGLRAFLRFADQGLILHWKKEEEVLFPALGKHIGTGPGPIAVMLDEHRDEKRKINAIRRALEGDPAPEDRDRIRRTGNELSDHLRLHIYKEENALFAQAEKSLSPDEKSLLLDRMAAIGYCCPT